MKTIEINAYEYSELSEKAKLKALIEAFLSEMCKDYEYQLSEEKYAEMCEIIGLWFDEDGNQIY